HAGRGRLRLHRRLPAGDRPRRRAACCPAGRPPAARGPASLRARPAARRSTRQATRARGEGRRSLPGVGLSRPRAAALLGILTAGVVGGQLLNASIFSLKRLDVPAPRWTDVTEARARLGVPLGTN